jgi:Polysaccharide lyase
MGSDDKCLHFSQTYDPEYRLRYHAEVVLQNSTKRGEIEFYGFALKLADNWQFHQSFAKGDQMPTNRIAIAQFISHFRDIDCGANEKIAVPTTMIWLQNDEVFRPFDCRCDLDLTLTLTN